MSRFGPTYWQRSAAIFYKLAKLACGSSTSAASAAGIVAAVDRSRTLQRVYVSLGEVQSWCSIAPSSRWIHSLRFDNAGGCRRALTAASFHNAAMVVVLDRARQNRSRELLSNVKRFILELRQTHFLKCPHRFSDDSRQP